MRNVNLDGVVFIPEMMDDVVLKSDLLETAVVGRDAVAQTLEKLESLYTSQELVFEQRFGRRDIRICRAVIQSGEDIELTTVAIRDANGWVCELHLAHHPIAPVTRLLAATR